MCILLENYPRMRPESHDSRLFPFLKQRTENTAVTQMDTIEKTYGYNHLTRSKS